jgi:inosose dehydratase
MMETNRRKFLKMTGVGLAAAAMPSFAYAGMKSTNKPNHEYPFQLGIASYSFRNFSLEDTIKMTQRLDMKSMSVKNYHLKVDATDNVIAETIKKFNDAGIHVYGGGVIYMGTKEAVDQAFEYARKAGMEMIIGVPQSELLPYAEQKVKEYNIKLAIHNHGPKDKNYPSAESAYVKIKNMDPRMGLCIDIGHTKRLNRDPERDIKDFFDRVFDVHVKDVDKADETGKTCEIGRGVINFPQFLKEVIKLKYKGTLALEFEKDAADPLPGMAESIGYLKGVLATLG